MENRKLFLGQQIAHLRQEHGWSLNDLAQRIGVKRQTLHTYEQGKIWPSVETLVALARELDCSTDYLLGLSDHP